MSYKKLLREKLKIFDHYSYSNDLQKEATESIFRGHRDIFIRMPNRFGKSICFQLPVIIKDHAFAIVISPSILHAKKEVDYLKSRNIQAYFWNSGTSNNMQMRIKNQITSRYPDFKLLYITPEKFASSTFQFILRNIKLKCLSYLVIDEAHCVSNFGHNFRKSYEKLTHLNIEFLKIPLIAVTSVANAKIQQDIIMQLKMKKPLEFIMPVFRSNIFHDVWCIETLANPAEHLLNFIREVPSSDEMTEAKDTCGIIICEDQDTVLSLARYLSSQGISTSSYNIGVKIGKRLKTLQKWESGEVNVITTKSTVSLSNYNKSVRFVVHWYNFVNLEKYYQESEQAGLDGSKSHSRIYYSFHDIFQKPVESTMTTMLPSQVVVEEDNYFLINTECRHNAFAKYFGDSEPECTRNCDVCVDKISIEQMSKQVKDLIHNFITQNNSFLNEYTFYLNESQYTTDLDPCTSQQNSISNTQAIFESNYADPVLFKPPINFNGNENHSLSQQPKKKMSQCKRDVLTIDQSTNSWNKTSGSSSKEITAKYDNVSKNVKRHMKLTKTITSKKEMEEEKDSPLVNKLSSHSHSNRTDVKCLTEHEEKQGDGSKFSISNSTNCFSCDVSRKADLQMKEIKKILSWETALRCEHIKREDFFDAENWSAKTQMTGIKQILLAKGIEKSENSKPTYSHDDNVTKCLCSPNDQLNKSAKLQMNEIKGILMKRKKPSKPP